MPPVPAAFRPARHWRAARAICVILSLALAATWLATLTRDGWAVTWPRYFALHKGRFILLSPAWNGGWRSSNWIYDRVGPAPHPLLPNYERIGDTYGGMPFYTTNLYAASVPIWNLATITGAGAVFSHRRVRRWIHDRGVCPACGYSLAELKGEPGGLVRCPECGERSAWRAPAGAGPQDNVTSRAATP